MKKLTLIPPFIGVFLFLSGCLSDPISRREDPNGVTVSLITTVDGCKIYRISDGSGLFYFSACESEINYPHKEGKMDVNTQTITIAK